MSSGAVRVEAMFYISLSRQEARKPDPVTPCCVLSTADDKRRTSGRFPIPRLSPSRERVFFSHGLAPR